MINIISRAYVSKNISGPKKVVDNLIKGLDLIGYPYVINKDLNSCKRLWIHDDKDALARLQNFNKDIYTIAGPNIYILPRNIPSNTDFSRNTIYIHPSPWVVDFWKYLGFNSCPIDSWPAGIDTDEFKPVNENNTRNLVVVYFKQRYAEELSYLEKILNNLKIDYKIIYYGKYDQTEYIRTLKNTKYIVWLGRQESQGIALEEAMSMNVPILVWDVNNVGHWTPSKKEQNIFTTNESSYTNTTSAYYFDERCGIKTKDRELLSTFIQQMEYDWQMFEPRKFILENLGLEKQATALLALFDKYFGLTYESGLNEEIRSHKKWRNGKIAFRVFMYFKRIIKKCVR